MRLVTLAASALLAVLATAPAAPAAKRVYGSDLRAPAAVAETHQADTAFWPVAIRGRGAGAPASGQILAIRLKGTARKDRGGPDPLNEVHFQSLHPLPDGSMLVQTTSQPFYVPFSGPRNQVSVFKPENLCVKKGDVVDFNDEGGWGGPSSPFYSRGVPFRVFGRVPGSATARYTADNGTNNGTTLRPTVVRGRELLMQLVLGTGPHRSEPCGGPRRHPDGSLVKPDRKMHVVVPQRAYVRSDRRVEPTLYCRSASPCSGRAKLVSSGRKIAAARFRIQGRDGAHVPMRLSRAAYRALRREPGDAMRVRLVARAGDKGPFAGVITIRH